MQTFLIVADSFLLSVLVILKLQYLKYLIYFLLLKIQRKYALWFWNPLAALLQTFLWFIFIYFFFFLTCSFELKLLLLLLHHCTYVDLHLIKVLGAEPILLLLALGLGAAPQLPQLGESEEAQVRCRAEPRCQEGLGHLSFGLRHHHLLIAGHT